MENITDMASLLGLPPNIITDYLKMELDKAMECSKLMAFSIAAIGKTVFEKCMDR